MASCLRLCEPSCLRVFASSNVHVFMPLLMSPFGNIPRYGAMPPFPAVNMSIGKVYCFSSLSLWLPLSPLRGQDKLGWPQSLAAPVNAVRLLPSSYSFFRCIFPVHTLTTAASQSPDLALFFLFSSWRPVVILWSSLVLSCCCSLLSSLVVALLLSSS